MRPRPSCRALAAGQHLPVLLAPPQALPRGQKSPSGVTQPPAPSCHHLSLLARKHFRKPKPRSAARPAGSDSALSQRCLQRGAGPSSALMSPLPPHCHASCACCQGHGAEITANKSISACRACFRRRADLKHYGLVQALRDASSRGPGYPNPTKAAKTSELRQHLLLCPCSSPLQDFLLISPCCPACFSWVT